MTKFKKKYVFFEMKYAACEQTASATSLFRSDERGAVVVLDTAAEYLGLGKQGTGLLVEGVLFVVDNLFNPGVDDHLRAGEAGAERHVDGGIFRGDTVIGGLREAILLGVGADAVAEAASRGRGARATRATAVHAILDATRRAIVAGGDDAAVFDDDSRNAATGAVAACADNVRDVHEVRVPVRTAIARFTSAFFFHVKILFEAIPENGFSNPFHSRTRMSVLLYLKELLGSSGNRDDFDGLDGDIAMSCGVTARLNGGDFIENI